jgi:hypothetical protein
MLRCSSRDNQPTKKARHCRAFSSQCLAAPQCSFFSTSAIAWSTRALPRAPSIWPRMTWAAAAVATSTASRRTSASACASSFSFGASTLGQKLRAAVIDMLLIAALQSEFRIDTNLDSTAAIIGRKLLIR